MRVNQLVEILDSGIGEFDAGHFLQLVQRDRLPGHGLLETELSTLMGTGYPIEKRSDVARIWIGFVQGTTEQRSRNRPWLHVHAAS
jgi:hypothetical protein